MQPVKCALIIPLLFFAPYANAQTDMAAFLKGSWGTSADCTPSNSSITYDYNSAGNLVGTQQAPADPKQPHLKRTYSKMFMNGTSTATLISNVTDVKTAKELGTLETEIELDDQKYKVKNQKANGKPIVSSGTIIARGQPTPWLYKCSGQNDTVADIALFQPVPISPEENKEKTCQNNKMLQNVGRSTKLERIQTDEDFIFTPETPSKTFSVMSAAEVIDSTLIITFEQISLYEELKGKVFKTIEKTTYDASPGTALIGHTLTLGIGLLMNPGKSLQHALGCTDEEIIKKEVAIALSKPTGKFSTRETFAKHNIRISGFGEPQTIEVTPNPDQNPQRVSINLLPMISKMPASNITNLSVSCITCNSHLNDSRVTFKNPSTTASLSYDFRQIQRQITEAQRIKDEENARIAEEQRKRELAEKERQRKVAEAEIARQKRIEQDILEQRRKVEQEEMRKKQQREKQQQIFNL
jgi:hypothetical protein